MWNRVAVSLLWALLLLLPLKAAGSDCQAGATVRGIRMTPGGLLIETAAQINASLSTAGKETTVQIGLPLAKEAPARVEWASGPVEEVALEGDACNTTVRIRSRRRRTWFQKPVADGLLVVTDSDASQNARENARACATAVVESFESRAEGLLIHVSGPVRASFVEGERSASSVREIELSGADVSAAPSKVEWSYGPVAAIRLRVKQGCEARLRVESREAIPLILKNYGSDLLVSTAQQLGSLRKKRLAIANELLRPGGPHASPGTAPCLRAVEISDIVPTAEGIEIRSDAALDATIRTLSPASSVVASAVPEITVEIPNAALRTVARAEWSEGPFTSMRASRFQSAEGCGVRIRLQPREARIWRAIRSDSGLAITDGVSASERTRTGEDEGETRLPGAVSIGTSATASEYRREGMPGSSTGYVSGAFAQQLSSGAAVRGFVSVITPASRSESPFAGVGISGLRLRSLTADLSVGDLYLTLGSTGDSDSASSITSATFRGAGATLQRDGRAALQLFGGRAATSSLIRVGTGSLEGLRGKDRIIGAQATWQPIVERLGFAAGLIRTDAGEAHQLNVFQSIQYRRSELLRVRTLLEESRSSIDHKSGYAFTVESRASLPQLSLDGYYRWLSDEFRPAGGVGFYGSLRQSYGLAASYHADRFAAGATVSQAKIFSIFDPQNVGSLTSSSSVTGGYRITGRLSVNGSWGESSVRSDPGALVRADSVTRQAGGGVGASYPSLTVSLQFIGSETRDRFDRHFDFNSRRADLDVRTDFWHDLYLHASFADSRRSSGARAGSDYRGAIGGSIIESRALRLLGETGLSVLPAGVAHSALRQMWGTLQIVPTRRSWGGGSIQFTYQRIDTGEVTYDAFLASLATNSIVRWGTTAFPIPQFANRAMRLSQPVATRAVSSSVRVHVFEDLNADSSQSAEEADVPGAVVGLGNKSRRTGSNGIAEFPAPPGEATVVLLPKGAAIAYYLPQISAKVVVPASGPGSVNLPLRPAGRIVGKVLRAGSGESFPIGGLIVTVSGPVEKQIVSNALGEFDSGLLPVGKYRVEFGAGLIQSGLAPVSAEPSVVNLLRGERREVVLTVRKATARERFGRS